MPNIGCTSAIKIKIFDVLFCIALGLDKFLTLENANNICILLA